MRTPAADAAATHRRALADDPAKATAWHDLAIALLGQGEAGVAPAVAALSRAARVAPGEAAVLHDLGLALRRAGRLDEAIASQRRAVALRGDLIAAHMSLGNALLDRGRPDAARAALRRALALGPASPECWYNLANACCGDDDAAALRAYGRAGRLGLGLARTRVADVLAGLGRLDGAEAVLLDSLPRPGTDVASAIEQLAGVLVRRGRVAAGRDLFTRLAATPLAGVAHTGECLTALAAFDLHEDAPHAAAERLAAVQGDNGWFFTVKSLAALRVAAAARGVRLDRPARPAGLVGARPRLTSSTLASKGRFAHTVMEYILVRLYAERHGFVLETPDWVGGAYFELDDPPQSRPLPPLLFARRLLNDHVAGATAAEPPADRDILSPLFLFEHREEHRRRVQAWLRPRPVWAPFLDPAVARLRAAGATVVALHIRRGDFVRAGYPVTDTGWYVAWLRALWPGLDRPVLYLASDDLPAVRAAFAEFNPVARPDVAPVWPGLEYLQDFHVLSEADVVGVSAASGFGALAARLNRRARLLVEPDVAARCIRPFRPWVA